MRRYAAVAMLLGVLSGCMNLDTGPETGGMRPVRGHAGGPPSVPGVQGPYGQPVPMVAPYSSAPPGNLWAAQQMMRNPIPMNAIQAMPNGTLAPPGLPPGPGAPPGSMPPPGPNGGPGMTMGNRPPAELLQAQFAMNPAAAGQPQGGQRTQVRFLRPIGMQVSWYAQGSDGKPVYSPTPIDTPGKYNFVQGARYRLKLTNIPGRPGVELYPTLEVVPGGAKTEAFLAHNNVPVEFTDEDFKQIADGNYIVKVVYLPDPQFQDVAGTGTDEILSTRLEPGQDPIQEAVRRGSILLVIRMGNIDQEAPNTPPLTSAPAGAAAGAAPPMRFGPTMPGMMNPSLQVPFWGMGPGGPGGMVPPGVLPPGMVPPGMVPPGMVPPGVVPPGVQPGALPPGVTQPGAALPSGPFVPPYPGLAPVPGGSILGPTNPAPSVPSPLTPAPLMPPATKLSPTPSLPGADPLARPPQAAETGKVPTLPEASAPVTPISLPPAVDSSASKSVMPPSPGVPPAQPQGADNVTAPARSSLPTPFTPGLPK